MTTRLLSTLKQYWEVPIQAMVFMALMVFVFLLFAAPWQGPAVVRILIALLGLPVVAFGYGYAIGRRWASLGYSTPMLIGVSTMLIAAVPGYFVASALNSHLSTRNSERYYAAAHKGRVDYLAEQKIEGEGGTQGPVLIYKMGDARYLAQVHQTHTNPAPAWAGALVKSLEGPVFKHELRGKARLEIMERTLSDRLQEKVTLGYDANAAPVLVDQQGLGYSFFISYNNKGWDFACAESGRLCAKLRGQPGEGIYRETLTAEGKWVKR